MMRRSVVLPQPDGPSSATSFPLGTSTLTSLTAQKLPNVFVTFLTWMLTGAPFRCTWSILRRSSKRSPRSALVRSWLVGGPLEPGLHDEGHQRDQRQERRDRERPGQVVFLEQLLDAQRHRVGLSGDVPGHDVDRAELAHRARRAQDDAVDEAPLHV